jgi:hypothetical protein
VTPSLCSCGATDVLIVAEPRPGPPSTIQSKSFGPGAVSCCDAATGKRMSMLNEPGLPWTKEAVPPATVPTGTFSANDHEPGVSVTCSVPAVAGASSV